MLAVCRWLIVIVLIAIGTAEGFNFHPSESGSGVPNIDFNQGAGGFLPPGILAGTVLTALDLDNCVGNTGLAQGTLFGTFLGKTSGSTLSITAQSQANGFQIGSPSGVATLQAGSGYPSVGGSYTVTVAETLAGSPNSPRSTTLTVTVNTTQQAPVITSSLTATGTVGTAFSYQITATNGPTSYNATNLPGGLSVNTSGLISGNPNTAATTNISISATNATGTGSATLVLTVNPAPQPPVINSTLTASGNTGSPFSYQITATNNPTSYNATNLPANLAINTSTGVISGTPTTAATTNVTISATNANGTGSATLVVTVNATATLAALDLDTCSAVTGLAQGTVIGNVVGKTSGSTLAITSQSQANGYQIGAPSGAATLQAGSGYPSVAGSYNVTIAETLAGATNSPRSTTLTVTVSPTQQAPVITSSLTATGTVNSAFSYQITATNNPTSYNATNLPANLAINTSTGVISGTPTTAATTNIAISATNGTGTGSATLVLTVNPAVQPPVINSVLTASGNTGNAFNYNITATNSPTSYNATNLPANLVVNTATGVISGTPTVAATTNVTISATNSAGTGSATLVVTISTGSGVPVIAGAGSAIQHVVVVMEENQDYASVYPQGGLPYFNSLANTYGLAQGYYGTNHPSMGNYFNITTGQTISTDDAFQPAAGGLNVDNIIRRILAAGQTWKEYCENRPSVGYFGNDVYPYIEHHCPAGYFSDVRATQTQLNNLVDTNQLATDITNGTLPNFMFIEANQVNNAHDGSLATADSWLQTHVGPLISNSTLMANTIVIVTFDEATTGDSTNGGGHVYWAVVGPSVKPAYKSNFNFYSHPSSARLILEKLGLPFNMSGAATAPSMAEFFNPSNLTASGSVGTAFSYQITASNSPTSYNATPLPAGLTINTATGVISGTPQAVGTTNVTISATNASGTGSATLVITVTATLQALSLDNSTANTGLAQGSQIGNILGKTLGSTLAITSQSQANGFQIDSSTGTSRLQAGSGYPSVAGSYTVTVAETLAGATNSPRTSVLTVTVSAPNCTPSAFNPANPAASGYVLVRSDNFANTSTIDMADSNAAGFHWYRRHFFGYPTDTAGNLTTDANGLVINSSDFAGENYSIATASPSGGTYVGTTFSKGFYIESKMAFDGASENNANGWPAFWSMAVEHMQATHNDQWPGQAAGYEHFAEDDFFEYDNKNIHGQWGTALHDWFGNPPSQINNAPGGGTPWQNAFQQKPGVDVTWNLSTFHTIGNLYVAGDAANGGNGYRSTYIDNVASVSTSGPTSTKVTWTDTITTPAALPSSTAVFAIEDQDHMVVILGTGVGLPYHIAYVNVWQIPGCGVMTSQ